MKSTIDQLIINSPYEEAKQYWNYDRETRFMQHYLRVFLRIEFQ
jgi:hypothetical protein